MVYITFDPVLECPPNMVLVQCLETFQSQCFQHLFDLCYVECCLHADTIDQNTGPSIILHIFHQLLDIKNYVLDQNEEG